MTTHLQVAVDCENPHALCRFWAAALGYEVEDHSGQIKELLESGVATDDDTATFEGQLVWKIAAACQDPEGIQPRMLFQVVPEAKTTKNRVHLDLHVAEGERAAEVDRLLALGATKLWDGQLGPQTWVTLADPEGNEFCVA